MGSDFDIFAPKPIQSAVLETIHTVYKQIDSVDQSDLDFLIPANPDTYLDFDFKLFVKGKLVKPDGDALDNKDFTAGTNNFLHSLFSQCIISLNGTQITQATELYNY